MLHIFISAADGDVRPGATGKPVPGYVARVVDEHGNTVPPGTVGRLAVQGPTGCRYLADERQRNYVKDGWNLTGDAYVMDEDGYFHYHSRTDDMIVSSGYNIASPEVEDALMQHPAVAECGDRRAGRGARTDRQGLRRAATGPRTRAGDGQGAAGLRQADRGPVQVPARHRVLHEPAAQQVGKLLRYRLREGKPS